MHATAMIFFIIAALMASQGYDGIWFGIFVTIMATIGLISPPAGLTVFVIQAQNPDIPALALWLPAALRV